MKKALITGLLGQDSFFLSKLLLEKGYEVHGTVQPSNSSRAKLDPRITVHQADATDTARIYNLLSEVRPNEIYSLAACSHVHQSFSNPRNTIDSIVGGAINLLEAIRALKLDCRIYNAGSSEQFGSSPAPQNELTEFNPQSPYANSKVMSYNLFKNYREGYGIFASNGILFNHESERRPETFVTRKITLAVARIAHGLQHELKLGNIKAVRDWGYSPDYVEGMWRILQHDKPDDFVLSTGESHSIEEFLTLAFAQINSDWTKYVVYDKNLERPTEVNELRGDSSKAKLLLRWEPKVTFRELVKLMVQSDLQYVKDNEVRGH